MNRRTSGTEEHSVRKDEQMAYSLACRDAGVDCSFVAEGETIEQVLTDGGAHAKEIHGYTDEQLADPELNAQLRSVVKVT